MNPDGLLIIISGFSGSGKGTVVKELLKRYNYTLSISATTRQPRQGEVEGRDYFFVTDQVFCDMIERKDLIEWATYCNHYYGTPRHYIEQKSSEGRDVILEIEMQGALKVKQKYPGALLIFITPPTIKELRRRLISRGTEDMAVINMRLKQALEESKVVNQYDYCVVNDDLTTCTNEIHCIIQSEHKKTSRNLRFIEQLQNELNA